MIDIDYDSYLNGTSYYIPNANRKYCPISILDHVLCFKNNKPTVKFFSPFDSKEITETNFSNLLEEARGRINSNIYTATDHLIIYIKVDDVGFLYVSLDNSVRATSSGFPLKGDRLNGICQIINGCLSEINDPEVVVFCSEACRMSFDGNIQNKQNIVMWSTLADIISRECGLTYLCASANNHDNSNMSFGIAAFCKGNRDSFIRGIITDRILSDEIGSGAVGITLLSEKIIWGIQLPFDFKPDITKNRAVDAMIGLISIMRSYGGSFCAIGDYNTLPGLVTKNILSMVPDDMELTHWNFPTFIASFFDFVDPREGEIWNEITA